MSTVSFNISRDFIYCRCRACDYRMLWFVVFIRTKPDYYDAEVVGKPYVYLLQAPDKAHKSFCPTCGKKELWAEESEN